MIFSKKDKNNAFVKSTNSNMSRASVKSNMEVVRPSSLGSYNKQESCKRIDNKRFDSGENKHVCDEHNRFIK